MRKHNCKYLTGIKDSYFNFSGQNPENRTGAGVSDIDLVAFLVEFFWVWVSIVSHLLVLRASFQ
jgi:hypothetical protein